MSWCLIESDPAVFWEILHKLGCDSFDFEEFWSLEDDTIRQTLLNKSNSDDLSGLIFLYRYGSLVQKESNPQEDCINGPIFMKQVIENSCATQSLLSVILNQPESISLGETLHDFKELIACLDPETRGWALSNHPNITQAHNAFGATNQLTTADSRPKSTELPFHYVAFVPFQGQTYMLDGLQAGPVVIGQIENSTPWYSMALKYIQDLIATATNQAITFNLIGVVPSQYPLWTKRVGELRQALRDQLATGKPDCAKVTSIVGEIDKIKVALEEWNVAKHALLADNELRKMSMIPLYIEVLKALAGRGLLPIFDSN